MLTIKDISVGAGGAVNVSVIKRGFAVQPNVQTVSVHIEKAGAPKATFEATGYMVGTSS